ncbi:MAG: protein kinase domain-containing protein, partial [Pyrinomonadaceae bacterium]
SFGFKQMITVGENFLHYKILSSIGSGGMGEVYLAKDNQLERKVAIKVLRKKFSKNEDGLLRFIREAKAASALNHPNIITIYAIGEFEEANYIASEFIDGKTLHSMLANGPLSIGEVLNIAIQTAEAIAAAHSAGIIHRDIKPENVMVRKDGYVKVLDFGLAKLIENEVFAPDYEAVTHRLVQTNPGVVMGTVSYMSPEQTRGKGIDTRSDIWSLGVLIYEMIAGELPFSGDSTSDVIAAILTGKPEELSQYSPEMPKELEHVVEKALRKDREERYQDVKDLLIDLKDIRTEFKGSGSSNGNGFFATEAVSRGDTTGEPAMRGVSTRSVSNLETRSISDMFVTTLREHPRGVMAGVSALFLLTIFAALFVFLRTPQGEDGFQSLRFAKITSSGNAEGGNVAVSPDGKYVAYAIRDGANQSLSVKNVSTDSSIQIVAPSASRFRGITFDPDSGFIYYVISSPDGLTSINRISVLGGESRQLLNDADGPVTFSPKGDRFAFIRNDRVLLSANSDGSDLEEISKAADGEVWWLPSWSPDGKTVAVRNYTNANSRAELIGIDVGTKERQKIGSGKWLSISGLAWNSDGRELKLSGRDSETELSQIWSVSFPDGKLTRITNDPGSYQGLSVSADGKTAVSIQQNRFSNIWVAEASDIENPKKVTTDVGTDDGMSGVALSQDGSIVYTARATGTQDIWSVDADGKNKRQLTENAGKNFQPSFSTDGRTIVFTSYRLGSLDIWRMDRDGRNPIRLTDFPSNESRPSFTADGKWIVFQRSGDDGLNSIWKMPIGGGEAVQISPTGTSRPRLSPDGLSIVCQVDSDAGKKIAILSVENGAEIRKFDFPQITAASVFDWSSDGISLIYINRLDGAFEVWSQPLSGGSPRRLARSKGDRIYNFDVSENGKELVFSRGTESSDAIMISGIR